MVDFCRPVSVTEWLVPDPMPPDTTSFTFTIPWIELGFTEPPCGTLLYLQVHAAINDAVTNTQVGSAYAGTFKGRITYEVTCGVPPQGFDGCTYTQGYWKNHPSAWPVSGLTIGGVFYTRVQLLNLLKTPVRADASLILGDQLIAALLNVIRGAVPPPVVSQAINDAQTWMTTYEDADGLLAYGIRPTADGFPNPAVWDEAINLGAVLDLFNRGLNGPPHCSGMPDP